MKIHLFESQLRIYEFDETCDLEKIIDFVSAAFVSSISVNGARLMTGDATILTSSKPSRVPIADLISFTSVYIEPPSSAAETLFALKVLS